MARPGLKEPGIARRSPGRRPLRNRPERQADQRLLLASAIADAGKTAEQMQGLVAAWAAGDVERILKDFDDASLSPELEKRLFRDRNAAWADWVQAALKKPGRHFMAVGAAHMAGRHSLIALLKARGLKVKRVQ
jgi:uncharacterized protein YbaP (TraB family)